MQKYTVPPPSALLDAPFQLEGPTAFDALALELFHLHAAHNPVYRSFLTHLGCRPSAITSVDRIPFLPITAFRAHRVLLEGLEATITFTSSGTTGAITSSHHLPWPELYHRSFRSSFRSVYGDPQYLRIIGLLPAYLERQGSSLVHMVHTLAQDSGDPLNGMFLHQYEALMEVLRDSEANARKTLLIGVPFALLDLAERHATPLQHVTILETGGMKGRRPEMVREALHGILQEAFNLPTIHGEYGMTELLSQAWSSGNGIYHCPPWMRVLPRDPNDPLAAAAYGQTAALNVIDLANIASCPFIATQDLGRVQADGSFSVLGRLDNSDLRGCNLLAE